MRKVSLTLRIAYAACLIGATATHVATHVRFGVLLEALPSERYSIFTRVYWSALTLLDPIAAVMLFVRPRWGLVLTLGIIVSDVAHNSWLVHQFGAQGDFMYWCQVGFLVFVVATVKIFWSSSVNRVAPRNESPNQSPERNPLARW